MSADPVATRVIRSWLSEPGPPPGDRVLRSVLDQLPATPQRRPPWSARRYPRMHGFARLALAAAAVIVVAAVGAGLLGQTPAAIGPGAATGPTPTPSASPTLAPTPLEEAPRATLAFTPHHLSHGVPTPFDQPYGVSLTVPDGWTNIGWAILKDDAQPPSGAHLALWDIGKIFLDPCHWATSQIADPPMVRRADWLAEALTWYSVPSRMSPTAPLATAVEPATLGGIDGYHLALDVPDDVSFAACDRGQYRLWLAADGSERFAQGPGQHEELWIVDLDGDSVGGDTRADGGLLVVDAGSFPGTASDDLAALRAMVDSIRIEPPVMPAPTPSAGAPSAG